MAYLEPTVNRLCLHEAVKMVDLIFCILCKKDYILKHLPNIIADIYLNVVLHLEHHFRIDCMPKHRPIILFKITVMTRSILSSYTITWNSNTFITNIIV